MHVKRQMTLSPRHEYHLTLTTLSSSLNSKNSHVKGYMRKTRLWKDFCHILWKRNEIRGNGTSFWKIVKWMETRAGLLRGTTLIIILRVNNMQTFLCTRRGLPFKRDEWVKPVTHAKRIPLSHACWSWSVCVCVYVYICVFPLNVALVTLQTCQPLLSRAALAKRKTLKEIWPAKTLATLFFFLFFHRE